MVKSPCFMIGCDWKWGIPAKPTDLASGVPGVPMKFLFGGPSNFRPPTQIIRFIPMTSHEIRLFDPWNHPDLTCKSSWNPSMFSSKSHRYPHEITLDDSSESFCYGSKWSTQKWMLFLLNMIISKLVIGTIILSQTHLFRWGSNFECNLVIWFTSSCWSMT